jgi:hypothetical protein
MSFSVFLDVLILVYFLSRQLRVRVVPRVPRLQLAVIIGLIGLVQFVDYTDHHHVTSTDYAWLVGTLLIGAVLLGAVRALTVKLWVANNWVVRQGTWVTMALWALSIGLHFVISTGAGHAGVANVEASSLLLYFGVTYTVQNYVVHRRALPLWASLGPDAGQGIRVNFGQGAGGGGAFFTTFRSNGQGFGPPPTAYDDPTIIDAEVVEENEGPAELH